MVVRTSGISRKAQLTPLDDRHLPRLIDFFAAERGLSEEPARTAERLRWMLWDNPAYRGETPSGWILESDEETIKGSLLVMPQRFLVGDAEKTFLASSAFFVSEEIGPGGGLIFREFLKQSADHVLFSTTTNDLAGRFWASAGRGRAVPQTDHELLGILNWSPMTQEFLARRRIRLNPPKALNHLRRISTYSLLMRISSARDVVLKKAESDFEEAESLWRKNRERYRVVGLRDEQFLRWRYLSKPGPRPDLLMIYDRGKAIGFVGLGRSARGHRDQIRAVVVQDFCCRWNPAIVSRAVGAVIEQYCDESDDIISLQGFPPECEDHLTECGFFRRGYGFSKGWFIDRKGEISSPDDWYMTLIDGDSFV